jgi:WD40 repeat protein
MRRLILLGVLLGGLAPLHPTPAHAQGGQQPAQPPGFVRRFGSDEFRDSHYIDMDVSPDAKVVAIAGTELRFWDLAERKLLRECPHADGFSVRKVRFSPDGKLVGCHYWEKVVVYDRATAKPLLTIPLKCSLGPALAFSPDSKLLATANEEGELWLWDIASGKQLAHSDRHRQLYLEAYPKAKDGPRIYADFNTLLFSPDGKHLVTGSYEGIILIWQVSPLKVARRLTTMRLCYGPMMLTPDGRNLVVCGEFLEGKNKWSGLATLDVETGAVRAAIKDYQPASWPLAISADGKQVAFSIGPRSYVWEPAAKRLTHKLPGSATALRFTADGTRLFGIADGARLGADVTDSLRGWDLKTGKELEAPPGHGSAVTAQAFAPVGKTVVSGGNDHTLRFWDAATGKQQRVVPTPEEGFRQLVFAPDGKHLAGVGDRGSLRLWDALTGKLLHTIWYNDGKNPRNFHHAAFSADGKTVVAATEDFNLVFHDVTTGKPQKNLRSYDGRFFGVARSFTWSADQKTIATCGGFGADSPLLRKQPGGDKGGEDRDVPNPFQVGFHVQLWDVPSGKVRQRLGHFPEPVRVAMTADGKTVAASDGIRIVFLDVATGRQSKTVLEARGNESFAPDGRTFATGNHLYVNGIDQPPVVFPFRGEVVVAFSPDGDQALFSYRGTATFVLWDLKPLRKK